ncbi:MAG: 5-methyltetrahydropteroyltriglutamate--homocysteine S-methyltransferase [Micavibrio aeruginosavorus]|uniref:5-methyltetrahydropteroyltriglutamate--homocysteine methyltransferase n=1 Tax=Micavibrio aeruginosavorus TaxID=349221 RepID=A0A2W5HMS2_9BACT|nr:MAG: 5-methyltetrahydropteroyltriglutamate--homocysteine S-methyltransferase [Micavibrio aeruginosavorus]
MVLALNLGFPRIGLKRELKKALESYWKGDISREDLFAAGKELRLRHWQLQKDAGISYVPVNDFSYYDHMLDTSCLLGVIPDRYDLADPDLYFSMARGSQKNGQDVIACEMTKWFDTNYHYIVPELKKGQSFKLSTDKIFAEAKEAQEAGFEPHPVLVGPITFLTLAKKAEDFTACRYELTESLAKVYGEICQKLVAQGITWIQLDEPCLCVDIHPKAKEAYTLAYKIIKDAAPEMNIHLGTYFEGLRENLDLAFSLPIAAIGVDLVRAPDQLDACIAKAKETGICLVLGLVDGRNVWKNDLSNSLAKIEKAKAVLGDAFAVSGSCSLLHSPIDLDEETALDAEVKSWMAFAKQKLAEISILARGPTSEELAASDKIAESRKTSKRIHNDAVQTRLKAVTLDMLERHHAFPVRVKAQQQALNLPAFPTTTIGSFPQTKEIRLARAAFKRGELSETAYTEDMKREIELVVKYQEEAGLDVPVHGEAERNDMVEYFGEQLDGFVFSKNGWVQSYGSRYVKPPIIFGDVSRPKPMTVQWSAYAQSLTKKPMKGMLTGPITILCWSFVRNDQPREQTAKQIALAIRDEVHDLEQAGIHVIQIDEPALREGLPLRESDRAAYLKWAVDAFKLSAATVEDTTQIHTHMCYAEFNDIIDSIAALDADVISIETSRSQMELLDAFVKYKYPNEIGPGVYDIHSPRVPSVDEMTTLLEKALKVLKPEQIWVNPDCGLKTRGWPETKAALENMVAAAKDLRAKVKIDKAA